MDETKLVKAIKGKDWRRGVSKSGQPILQENLDNSFFQSLEFCLGSCGHNSAGVKFE
jgi:hypothetical protein